MHHKTLIPCRLNANLEPLTALWLGEYIASAREREPKTLSLRRVHVGRGERKPNVTDDVKCVSSRAIRSERDRWPTIVGCNLESVGRDIDWPVPYRCGQAGRQSPAAVGHDDLGACLYAVSGGGDVFVVSLRGEGLCWVSANAGCRGRQFTRAVRQLHERLDGVGGKVVGVSVLVNEFCVERVARVVLSDGVYAYGWH